MRGAASRRAGPAPRSPARAAPTPTTARAAGGGGRGRGRAPLPRPAPPPPAPGAPPRRDSGFFGEADPKATVYPVRRGLGTDPSVRSPNRWESDFVWNQKWAEGMDYNAGVARQQDAAREARRSGSAPAPPRGVLRPGGAPEERGALSLATKVDLNSLDVDLSAALRPRAPPKARAADSDAPRRGILPQSGAYAAAPAFRGETRAWDRGGKFARRPVAPAPTAAAAAGVAARAAAEAAAYDAMKGELQAATLALGAAVAAAVFAFYGRDESISYSLGAVGGLLYLRGLNRQVDGVAGGGVGAALGANRLLIPIILVLGSVRYNALYADMTGVQLALLPTLAGFFTYKGAVVARQGLALAGDLARQAGGGLGGGGGEFGDEFGGEEREAEGEGGAVTIDRAFSRR
jgi:ATP synthase protein I